MKSLRTSACETSPATETITVYPGTNALTRIIGRTRGEHTLALHIKVGMQAMVLRSLDQTLDTCQSLLWTLREFLRHGARFVL